MPNSLNADIVIIGAGSAGAVLANRLSEDPELQVLVLEAGSRGSSFLADIPGMTMALMGNPKTDWCHQSQPDPTLNNRSLVWNAGKMLGGGSAINGMVYIRGLRRDYEDWCNEGCHGWSWEDIAPYFQRAEHFEDDSLESMGTSGPLPVSRLRSTHALTHRFIDACNQTGIPSLNDYNNGKQDGAFINLTNQRSGLRASTDYAYLSPARKRKNLRVIHGVHADQILIENGRAQGVRFIKDGCSLEATARRQVVVSAGTHQSPAILMRSGIGPVNTLQALGIDIKVNSPNVGSNLQEHVGILLTKFVNMPTYNSQMDPFHGLGHLGNYLLFRRGPLSSAAVQGMAWARSHPRLASPDIHLNWFPFGIDFTVSPPVFHKLPCVGLGSLVSRPYSRGNIYLRSKSPQDSLLINHRALDDERDLETLARSVGLIKQIFQAPALASAITGNASPFDHPMDDQELKETIKKFSTMGLHAVGTCRMGSDLNSVVDTELRVRGITGLRVVDASIMPRIISANTNAATIMLGERGADFIKHDIY